MGTMCTVAHKVSVIDMQKMILNVSLPLIPIVVVGAVLGSGGSVVPRRWNHDTLSTVAHNVSVNDMQEMI